MLKEQKKRKEEWPTYRVWISLNTLYMSIYAPRVIPSRQEAQTSFCHAEFFSEELQGVIWSTRWKERQRGVFDQLPAKV